MLLLLAPLLLAYFMLLGIAVAAAFARRIPTAVVLVSPVTGIGILLALTLSLNRMGIPVQSFGLALTLVLAAAAAAVIIARRPEIAWSELRDLSPAIAAGMLLAGAPILAFGFAWAGNSNPDMGLYVNSAANFLRHGFFDVADLATLRSNVDAARNTWFWEVMPPNRYGADALVAIAAAVFRVATYEIYMLVEVAVFGALIMATAALTLDRGLSLRTYVTATLIAVANPLLLYALYQQLMPQLAGQAAMVGVVALAQIADSGRASWQRGAALGCAAVAMLLIYPEISPIAVLGACVTAPFVLYAHRRDLRAFLIAAAPAAAAAVGAVLVLLNVQAFTVLATLSTLFRIGSTVAAEGVGAINYYLVPSGLANLWGFAPLDGLPEPWLSIAIVAGFVALVAAAAASFWALRRGRYADGMAAAVILFMLYLFKGRSSYGLFKMAFILQPFIAPFAAAAIVAASGRLARASSIRRPWSVAAVLAVAIGLTAFSSEVNLGSTADAFAHVNANYTALHAASTDGLYAQLDRIESEYGKTAPHAAFRTDALLPNLATIEGAAFFGHALSYRTLDPYSFAYGAVDHPHQRTIVGWPTAQRDTAFRRANERRKEFVQQKIVVDGKGVGTYIPPATALDPNDVLIETGPDLTILNRSASTEPFDVRAVPSRNVRNWLALVDSDLGFPPYTQLSSYAVGPVEPDPFAHAGTVATVGTSMLLEVINGDPEVRFRLELTGTLNPGRVDDLPQVTVTGTTTKKVGGLGNGAARIVTPPVRPFVAFGHRYVVLRFGERTLHFEAPRSWLMALFGRDVDLVPRRFATYGRDISLVDALPAAPSIVSTFPRDLFDRSLLFSGIYEDGWMSGTVRARMNAPVGGFFRLRVNVPPGADDHTIAVSIDGRPVKQFIAVPSTYAEVQFPSPGPGDHDIAMTASGVSQIGSADPRMVWGRLEALGFLPDIVGTGVDLADNAQWYPFETYQNRTFRWMKRTAHLRVAASRVRRVLRLEVAPGPSVGGKLDLAVTAGGRTRQIRVDRDQEIDVDVPAATVPLDVALSRPAGTIRVPNDPRDLTLRMFLAKVTNAR